jgi:hypothetical protein
MMVNPVILVEITIIPDKTEITAGEVVNFTSTIQNSGTNPVYAWFVNGVEVPGATLPTYSYAPQDGDNIQATLVCDLPCATPVPALSNIVIITVGEQPNDLVINSIPTHVLCYGDNTGAIELTVSEGTAPYIFFWNNGKNTQNIADLAAGTYTVTVTDADGLSAGHSVTIQQPDDMVLVSTKVDLGYSTDPIGSIDLTVTGGKPRVHVPLVGPRRVYVNR